MHIGTLTHTHSYLVLDYNAIWSQIQPRFDPWPKGNLALDSNARLHTVPLTHAYRLGPRPECDLVPDPTTVWSLTQIRFGLGLICTHAHCHTHTLIMHSGTQSPQTHARNYFCTQMRFSSRSHYDLILDLNTIWFWTQMPSCTTHWHTHSDLVPDSNVIWSRIQTRFGPWPKIWSWTWRHPRTLSHSLTCDHATVTQSHTTDSVLDLNAIWY